MIVVRSLRKSFKNKVVLRDLSFEIGDKTISLLIGPNASGKTTLLKIIAGLTDADRGEILINGRVVFRRLENEKKPVSIPPWDRGVGYVPSDPVLFEHLNVYENIALGARKRLRGEALDARVRDVIRMLDLESYSKAKPRELSHGIRQRVCIARALAADPQILLFDEPFSNIDPEFKSSLRLELKRLLKRVGVTSIIASNSAEDILYFNEMILVLERGVMVYQGVLSEDIVRNSSFIARALNYNVIPVKEASVERGLFKVKTSVGVFYVENSSDHSLCLDRGEMMMIVSPRAIRFARELSSTSNIVICEEVERSKNFLADLIYCKTKDLTITILGDGGVEETLDNESKKYLYIPPESIKIVCRDSDTRS